MVKLFLAFSAAIMFTACGTGASTDNHPPDSSKNAATTENLQSIPGIDKVELSDTIALEADENMRFDKELFKVKAGKKLRLILINKPKHAGMSMTHNVVILNRGTDIADFADAVKNAKDENYTPASVNTLMIAHTKQVSAGEKDEVEFVIPAAGVYDFICSFPGHWGTMQGRVVAE